MKRDRLIKEAEHELNASGYATVLAGNMHTFADVFAGGRGRKLIIKAVHNIDSVTRREAGALFKLAEFLDAEPIIIGSVAGCKKLEENVSRYRFDVRCISPGTLSSLTHGETKFLASKSFGIKTMVDGSRLRNLRKVNNLRVTELAKRAGLSKSTLYKHELQLDYASADTVAKLERILNGSIRMEEEVTQSSTRPLLNESKFARTGMQALTLHSAPFDIVAKDKNYYEISFDANTRTLIKRAALFKAIRETFEGNYPFFLSKGKKGRMRGVPVVGEREMLGVGSEDELLDLVY